LALNGAPGGAPLNMGCDRVESAFLDGGCRGGFNCRQLDNPQGGNLGRGWRDIWGAFFGIIGVPRGLIPLPDEG
jgi:hypothetical protein